MARPAAGLCLLLAALAGLASGQLAEQRFGEVCGGCQSRRRGRGAASRGCCGRRQRRRRPVRHCCTHLLPLPSHHRALFLPAKRPFIKQRINCWPRSVRLPTGRKLPRQTPFADGRTSGRGPLRHRRVRLDRRGVLHLRPLHCWAVSCWQRGGRARGRRCFVPGRCFVPAPRSSSFTGSATGRHRPHRACVCLCPACSNLACSYGNGPFCKARATGRLAPELANIT